MTERDLQGRIITTARYCGWACAHFHDSRRQVRPGVFVGDRDAAGFPDLILAHPVFGVMYAELKSATGRLRPAQEKWIKTLRAAGQHVYVWRPEDWPEVLDTLTYGPKSSPEGTPWPSGDAPTTEAEVIA